MRKAALISAASGETLVPNVEIADSFLTRLAGLMGRRTLPADAGLVIEPCNGVHCWFMRFPIDVVYLDKDWRVIKVDEAMKPWRIGRPVKGSRRVIELPGGAAKQRGIAAGLAVRLDHPEDA